MFKFAWLIGGLVLAGTLSAQVEPHAGQWKTWVIPSGATYRLPAPPDAAGTAACSSRRVGWATNCSLPSCSTVRPASFRRGLTRKSRCSVKINLINRPCKPPPLLNGLRMV